MSTKPKAIAAYTDCLQVLDRALASSGARLPFTERGKAVSFRQRCYRVRSLLQQRDSTSPYDAMYIQIEPLRGSKDEPATLIFLLRAAPNAMLESMRDLDGQEIVEAAADDEELEAEAVAFAKSLGLR